LLCRARERAGVNDPDKRLHRSHAIHGYSLRE
jgi:hypothetical protein